MPFMRCNHVFQWHLYLRSDANFIRISVPITIQIRRKIRFTVIPFQATLSLHIFAHATTAQPLSQVQTFDRTTNTRATLTETLWSHEWPGTNGYIRSYSDPWIWIPQIDDGMDIISALLALFAGECWTENFVGDLKPWWHRNISMTLCGIAPMSLPMPWNYQIPAQRATPIPTGPPKTTQSCAHGFVVLCIIGVWKWSKWILKIRLPILFGGIQPEWAGGTILANVDIFDKYIPRL